jgi:hypothetical protein
LASVGVDDVRDVINVSSAEVPDAKVLKMIKRAEVTLELETGAEMINVFKRMQHSKKAKICF